MTLVNTSKKLPVQGWESSNDVQAANLLIWHTSLVYPNRYHGKKQITDLNRNLILPLEGEGLSNPGRVHNKRAPAAGINCRYGTGTWELVQSWPHAAIPLTPGQGPFQKSHSWKSCCLQDSVVICWMKRDNVLTFLTQASVVQYLKNPVILINCLFLFKNTEFKIFRLAFGQMNPYHWLQLSSLTQILIWKKGRNTQGNYKCCANPQENNNFYLAPTLVSLCNTQLSFLIPTLFLWSFPVHRPSQTFPVLQAETEITAEVDKLSKRDRFWTWC